MTAEHYQQKWRPHILKISEHRPPKNYKIVTLLEVDTRQTSSLSKRPVPLSSSQIGYKPKTVST